MGVWEGGIGVEAGVGDGVFLVAGWSVHNHFACRLQIEREGEEEEQIIIDRGRGE